ncbi:hypothetical protein JCM8202_002290 [Rhodotorula sphaerocarpa]
MDRLSTLPTGLLLRILAELALPDLVLGVKPTSRTLYLPATSLARQQGLPLWLDEVARTRRRSGAPPGSTALGSLLAHAIQPTADDTAGDGLPSYSQATEPPTPFKGRSREMAVFDLFVATLARSLSRLAASMLLLTGEDDVLRIPGDARLDLFGHLQPKARCEDVVIEEGRRTGWIVEPDPSRSESSNSARENSTRRSAGRYPTVLADDIRVDLKLRDARLLLPLRAADQSRTASGAPWRGVASVQRRTEDSIEAVARTLAEEGSQARVVRVEDGNGGHWYER